MQRIIIKNFGAIESADIELKKFLLLIGEQASGKSTIAKLVYFFKTLPQALLEHILSKDYKFDVQNDFQTFVEKRFLDLFGTKNFGLNGSVTVYYPFVGHISVHALAQGKIFVNNNDFEINTLAQKLDKINNSNLTNGLPEIGLETIIEEQRKAAKTKNLWTIISRFFNSSSIDDLFVVAGRNSTVAYSEMFELSLYSALQKKIINPENSTQTIEEFLMSKFIERSAKYKSELKKYGRIKKFLEAHEIDSKTIIPKIEKILKGNYLANDNGEFIVLPKRVVAVSDASSGQQEAIRILQDICYVLAKQAKSFRVIEEPEAHLFPQAQKELVELLAMMVNNNTENQLIITTHSPYILTVLNNLLFARRVVEKNETLHEEVKSIIGEAFWIEAKDFAAYTMGRREDGSHFCQSIVDEKTGLIEQNYLDTVSEELGEDFERLYALHSKNFRKPQ